MAERIAVCIEWGPFCESEVGISDFEREYCREQEKEVAEALARLRRRGLG